MWHSLAAYAHLSEQVRNALKSGGSWKIGGEESGKNSRASALCNFCALKARWGKFAAIVVAGKERERGKESESASGACNIKF